MSDAVQDLMYNVQNVTFDEDWSREDEDRLNGEEAGTAFAHRHIIGKINLFLEEYRRNGYSEDFVSGFIDGVNGVTGGSINLGTEDAETAS